MAGFRTKLVIGIVGGQIVAFGVLCFILNYVFGAYQGTPWVTGISQELQNWGFVWTTYLATAIVSWIAGAILIILADQLAVTICVTFDKAGKCTRYSKQ